jgi:hypothetical protein
VKVGRMEKEELLEAIKRFEGEWKNFIYDLFYECKVELVHKINVGIPFAEIYNASR